MGALRLIILNMRMRYVICLLPFNIFMVTGSSTIPLHAELSNASYARTASASSCIGQQSGDGGVDGQAGLILII